MLTWLKLPTFSTSRSHFKRSTFSPTRAIFVWPWDENARTKQKQQTNGNRAIWLVYGTDTNERGFWLVKRTLGWKKFMPENFLEINRYFALTSHCNKIGQSNNAFSMLRFFWRENEEFMFWSFHTLADKTNNEHFFFIFQGHTKIALSATCSVYKTLYSNLPFPPRWAGISRRSVSLCVDITSEYFPRVDYVPN